MEHPDRGIAEAAILTAPLYSLPLYQRELIDVHYCIIISPIVCLVLEREGSVLQTATSIPSLVKRRLTTIGRSGMIPRLDNPPMTTSRSTSLWHCRITAAGRTL